MLDALASLNTFDFTNILRSFKKKLLHKCRNVFLSHCKHRGKGGKTCTTLVRVYDSDVCVCVCVRQRSAVVFQLCVWGRGSVQRRRTGNGRWRLSAAPPLSSAALLSGSAGPSESDAPEPQTQSQ